MNPFLRTAAVVLIAPIVAVALVVLVVRRAMKEERARRGL